MSDSNRIQLTYAKNTGAYGALPSSGGKVIRVASEGLVQATESVRSKEIRADRQVTDIVRTGISVAGPIAGELSYGAYDDFIQWALFHSGSAWSAEVTNGAVNLSIASNVITRASGSWVSDGFAKGRWVTLSGFSEGANNGVYGKITAITATTLTIGAVTLVDEGAGASKTVTQLAYVENGTALTEFALERQYADLSNEFAQYVGCGLNGLSLAVNAKGIIEATFDVIGKKEQSATSSMDSTPDAAPTNDVMNAVDHVTAVYEGGYAAGNILGVLGFTLQAGNNLRARDQIGTLGAISLGTGSFDVRGTLRAYFQDKTLFDKYLSWTKTSLSLLLKDGASNRYFLDVPSCRLGSGRRVAGGQNQDIIADLTFEAYRDSTEGVTHRWSRDP